MAKNRSLLDEIKTTLPTRRGFAPWHETLPPDLREEVETIKRQWQQGALQATKTGLAQSLSKALKARGIQIGQLGVSRWLERP